MWKDIREFLKNYESQFHDISHFFIILHKQDFSPLTNLSHNWYVIISGDIL